MAKFAVAQNAQNVTNAILNIDTVPSLNPNPTPKIFIKEAARFAKHFIAYSPSTPLPIHPSRHNVAYNSKPPCPTPATHTLSASPGLWSIS